MICVSVSIQKYEKYQAKLVGNPSTKRPVRFRKPDRS